MSQNFIVPSSLPDTKYLRHEMARKSFVHYNQSEPTMGAEVSVNRFVPRFVGVVINVPDAQLVRVLKSGTNEKESEDSAKNFFSQLQVRKECNECHARTVLTA